MYDGLGPASIANPHVLASDPHFTGGGFSALLALLIRMKLALVLHYFAKLSTKSMDLFCQLATSATSGPKRAWYESPTASRFSSRPFCCVSRMMSSPVYCPVRSTSHR